MAFKKKLHWRFLNNFLKRLRMSLSCNFCNKKDRSPCSFIRYDGFFAEFLYLNDDEMSPWLRQELQFYLKITL